MVRTRQSIHGAFLKWIFIDLPFSLWREIGQIPAMLYYRSTNKQEPLKYIKSLEFKDLKDFLVEHGA